MDEQEGRDNASADERAQNNGAGEGSLAEEIAALVQREVEQVTASLRGEIERLQSQAIEGARETGRAAGLLGAAGGLALVSAGAVATLPLIMLRRLVPGWVIALAAAAGAGAGAAVLGRAGLEHVQAAAPDVVADRVEELKERVVEAVMARVRNLDFGRA